MTWLALALFACTDGADPDTEPADCSTRPIEVPTARGEAGGVWDDARGRLVFFGGDHGTPVNCQSRTEFVAEVWAFQADCGNFAPIETSGDAPQARGRHAVALDAENETLWFHGGRTRDGTSGNYTVLRDVWSLDLTTDTWTSHGEGGLKRSNHTAVIADGKLILFGGSDSRDGAAFSPMTELRAMDLATDEWTVLETTNDGPSARLFHSATVSPDGKTMYVYGGGDEGAFFGPFFGDLWALDLDTLTWTELDAGGGAGKPKKRIWAHLFAESDDTLVLWAGHDDKALGNTNQVWRFTVSSATWQELEAGDVVDNNSAGFCDFPADFVDPDLNAPERRSADVAALRPDGTFLTFGGKSDCGLLNDVWSYDLTTTAWDNLSSATSGEICQRTEQSCDTLCF